MTKRKKTIARSTTVTDRQRHDWQQDQFVAAGVQYYIAARGAALAGLMPVSGNLVHHAIEMLAKAGIIKHRASGSFEQTQDKLMGLGHKLRAIWAELQVCYPNAQFSGRDSLVAYLDRWEDIRYPDPDGLTGATGMAMSIPRRKGQEPVAIDPRGPTTEYYLNLEDCDELIKEMWQALGFTAARFRHYLHMSKYASDVYSEDNLHQIV